MHCSVPLTLEVQLHWNAGMGFMNKTVLTVSLSFGDGHKQHVLVLTVSEVVA